MTATKLLQLAKDLNSVEPWENPPDVEFGWEVKVRCPRGGDEWWYERTFASEEEAVTAGNER